MSTPTTGPCHNGPPAPYPAVPRDPITEQWWWDLLRTPRWRCNHTSRCHLEDGHDGQHDLTGDQ